jgi:hypothetical protein
MEYSEGRIWNTIDPIVGLSYINGGIEILGKLLEAN